MTSSEAYIVLNMLPKVGPVRVRRLVEALGSPEALLSESVSQLKKVEGISGDVAESIARWETIANPATELQRAAEAGASIITQADSNYPDCLRNIHDPPLVLYVRGRLDPRDARGIALIGARTPSFYGREMAKKLGYQIAYSGWTIVSGLARGIDTAAHEAALAAKGRTLAVLGCGIDQIYPPENKPLADRIAENNGENGAVISEFPIGTLPDKQTFPIRNRIVSGLSVEIVVVEASLTSGAMITARMALEQGRQVSAVPGRADTIHARGCHRLIKEGAKLVEEAADVLGEFDYLIPPSSDGGSNGKSKSSAPDISDEEKQVLEAIGDEERHIDLIIAASGLAAAKVSATLAKLQLKRLVEPLPGRQFVRTQRGGGLSEI